MMRISLILLSLSLLFISIDAAFPTVDFTGLLQKYATTTDGTWCTKCAAFGQPPCAMGCAGDGGGGGPCPANACPRLFTFPIVNNQPIWNIQVATAGDPYRAFSYIPLCTQASQCTESFFFSFSFKYTPGPNAAQSNFFSQQRDYLKLLFWGDGNNILGVKNGQLLGLPNGGGGDLVGSNNIGTGNAFAIPFLKDTWTHVGVQFNVNNGRTSLSFFINGVATGSTTGSVAIQNSGLQFGAYVWNGAFFTLQYKDIAITKNLPNVATPVTTAKPTTTTAPTIAPPAPVNPTQGFPSVDFTALLQKYATTTDGTWCSKCAAFGQPPCAMGCAGDGGGGGPCPVNACPRLFTFPIVNNQPIWNINVQTVGDPYRAFSYIPICTQAGQCIESFFFSFSFKYTPDATSAQTNFFSQTRDYLKLLFWGDGNNILGVKNGQLLGLPNGGVVDLVGSNNIGTGNAFAIPFLKDTWTHVGVQLNVNNGRTSLAFFINGVATGSTSGSVGVSNTGLQFGAYVWNGAKFTLQYKDIAITKNLPIISTGGGTTTTATPVTAMPTTATGKPTTTATPTAKVTSAPTPTATAKPTVPIKSTTTIPPNVTTSMPTETTPPIVDTVTSPPSVVTEQPPLDDTTNPPLDDTTDPPSSTDPPSVTTREPTPPPAGSGGPSMPIYNPATVALHNKATDCWTILDGVVYDISKLVLIHPGGAVIRSYCGIDCSTIFSSSHQNDSADRALLAKSYLKGTLGSMTTSTPTNPAIISIVSRSNHATTITSSLFCMMASLVVALVLEYLL